MANDQLVAAEPNVADSPNNSVRLISQFLPISEFQFQGHAARLFRPYVVLSKLAEILPNEGKGFDLRKLFEEIVGISPSIYFPLVFASMAKYLRLTADDFYNSPQSFALHRDWFSLTKLGGTQLDRVFGDISGDYVAFQGLLEKYDKGVNDFTAFRDCPLVKLDDAYYPLDFGFLAAKSESAFFWRAHNSLPSSERDDFHTFWGHVFENYMHRLMKSACNSSQNRYYDSPHYADREDEEACDGLILCQDRTAVVIEYKGSAFTADAKYGGNVSALEAEIHKKLIGQQNRDRKGVYQLSNAVESLFAKGSPRVLREVDLSKVTKVFPLLITRDEIGSTWYLTSYLNETFRNAVNKKTIRATVTPLFSMSVDHFEILTGTLKQIPLADILHKRYLQDKTLQMPFLLPNNEALSQAAVSHAPTIDEAGEELIRYARQLFENPPLNNNQK